MISIRSYSARLSHIVSSGLLLFASTIFVGPELARAESLTIALRAPDEEHFVTTLGSGSISADMRWVRGWEQLELVAVDGGDIVSGSQVTMETVHGKFVSASSSGSLSAGATEVSSEEKFTIEKIDGDEGDEIAYGDRIALRGAHGKYISAKSSGGSSIAANGPRIGGWERFGLRKPLSVVFDFEGNIELGASGEVVIITPDRQHSVVADGTNLVSAEFPEEGFANGSSAQISSVDGSGIVSGSLVSIKATNDKYWSANGNETLTASAASVRGWEKFVIKKIGGDDGEAIAYGDLVSLRGVHGEYVSAENYGGGDIEVDGAEAGNEERFVLWVPGN